MKQIQKRTFSIMGFSKLSLLIGTKTVGWKVTFPESLLSAEQFDYVISFSPQITLRGIELKNHIGSWR